VAGLITGWLNVRLKIMDLLASILMMIALYSVNLRIMGGPNVPLINDPTVFTMLQPAAGRLLVRPILMLLIVVVAKLAWTGSSPPSAAWPSAPPAPTPAWRAQGVNTGAMMLLGMAISNALVGLAGALFVQTQGGSDISMGIGTIVIGLAAVIVGETILPSRASSGPRWPWCGRHRLPLLHRAGAQQRLHRPEGAGSEPGDRRAGAIALVIPQLKRKLQQAPARRARAWKEQAMLSAQNLNSPSTPARRSKPARCAACRWTSRPASSSPSSAPTAPASPPS
jgi:putative ABC transport system permease protein